MKLTKPADQQANSKLYIQKEKSKSIISLEAVWNPEKS